MVFNAFGNTLKTRVTSHNPLFIISKSKSTGVWAVIRDERSIKSSTWTLALLSTRYSDQWIDILRRKFCDARSLTGTLEVQFNRFEFEIKFKVKFVIFFFDNVIKASDQERILESRHKITRDEKNDRGFHSIAACLHLTMDTDLDFNASWHFSHL